MSRYQAEGSLLDSKLRWPPMTLKYLPDTWASRLTAQLMDSVMGDSCAAEETGGDENEALLRLPVLKQASSHV
ncbi:hypothetical protein PG997_000621 [Apiospora hydei]|uniref:Uncharacterized protein n=1 Tax=Apiospora hydei TaxID=1337664 RepID=A0ABR1XB46_9PEZI